MCESYAYLKKRDSEELIMKDVVRLTPTEDGKIRLETILGDEKIVGGRLLEVDFNTHRILIEKDGES